MRFKYSQFINQLPDCPPSYYRMQEIMAFRFVYANINDQNNFLPALIKNPRRKLAGSGQECIGYGLSLFNSLGQAKSRYQQLRQNFKNIDKTIGTHIADGLIQKQDGVLSDPDANGHMTLHESDEADLSTKFRIVLKVY
jgi:hypothetical protein